MEDRKTLMETLKFFKETIAQQQNIYSIPVGLCRIHNVGRGLLEGSLCCDAHFVLE